VWSAHAESFPDDHETNTLIRLRVGSAQFEQWREGACRSASHSGQVLPGDDELGAYAAGVHCRPAIPALPFPGLTVFVPD
jgi:hypothetical protein